MYQLKLKTETKSLGECIDLFIGSCIEYKEHISVKKNQSFTFHNCIDLSSEELVVIQVDFAEKFKCLSQNEVQSAYFNQHGITIFTVMAWAGNKKFPQVYVTDDPSQSKYCVLIFLYEIINFLKEKLPHLKSVKMFSDGCAAQFKNRWTLSLILFAQELFGVEMTWDFFAPGHGKGAVDGIGGTVKRAVHQRILAGQVKVYTAAEFHQCKHPRNNVKFNSCGRHKAIRR